MSEPNGAQLRGALDLSPLLGRSQQQIPQQAEPGAASGALIREGTDANFTEFLDLSAQVPVLVDLWAEWCGPCKQLTPILEKLVAEYDGRFVLVKVDVDSNPQLAQAFQAQSIPTVVAVIAGRPVPLFTGAIPEAQVRDVLEQVLALAAQNGAGGRLATGSPEEADTEQAEPAATPLPPHHAEAYDAIERGDYQSAIAEYRTAIAQNPADDLAVAGLAQVQLLHRLSAVSAERVRADAAAAPDDVSAQLAVADLDISGGHIEDAFDRLLTLFPACDAAGKDQVRERLLDLFTVVGAQDPRVVKARGRLTGLLY